MAREDASKAVPLALDVGAAVRLHGLVARSDLNGTNGTCGEFLQDIGRWKVILEDGDYVKARAVNIEVRCLAEVSETAQVPQRVMQEMCRWTKAACIQGEPPMPAELAWSPMGHVALLTKTAVHVIDAEAALKPKQERPSLLMQVGLPSSTLACAAPLTSVEAVLSQRPRTMACAAWSPPGCGPGGTALLAVADSTGMAEVHALPLGDGLGNSWKPLQLGTAPWTSCEVPILEVGRGTVHMLRAVSPAYVEGERDKVMLPHIAFCPSVLSLDGASTALLVIAQGALIFLWRVGGQPRLRVCIACMRVDVCSQGGLPGRAGISALCVSPLCSTPEQQHGLTLMLGSSSGTVLSSLVNLQSSMTHRAPPTNRLRITRVRCEELCSSGSGVVTRIALATESIGVGPVCSRIVAVVRGLCLSVYLLQEPFDSAQQRIKLFAGTQLHSAPIVAVSMDVTGLLASMSFSDPFSCRLRILTLDMDGQAVLWRISENPEAAIVACASGSFLPTIRDNWLNSVERQVRTEEECLQPCSASKSSLMRYVGCSFSPSGCLLAVQTFERVAGAASALACSVVTNLFVTPVGEPAQLLSPLAWAIRNALKPVCSGHPLALPLWDIAAAWRLHHEVVGVPSTSPLQFLDKASSRVSVREVWWKSGDHDSIMRDAAATLVSTIGAGKLSPAHCFQWLAGLLLPGSWPASSSLCPQELQLARLNADQYRVAACQFNHAILELGAGFLMCRGQQVLSKTCGFSEALLSSASALQAVTLREYWSARLSSEMEMPCTVYRKEAILACLDDDSAGRSRACQLISECKLCGSTAEVDETLTSVSCGKKHKMPLCQRALEALCFESHWACSFCGKLSIWNSDTAVPERGPGVCVWCAAYAIPCSSEADSVYEPPRKHGHCKSGAVASPRWDSPRKPSAASSSRTGIQDAVPSASQRAKRAVQQKRKAAPKKPKAKPKNIPKGAFTHSASLKRRIRLIF